VGKVEEVEGEEGKMEKEKTLQEFPGKERKRGE